MATDLHRVSIVVHMRAFRGFKWKGSFEDIRKGMRRSSAPRLSIDELWKAYDEDNWEKLEEFQKSELFAQNDMFWQQRNGL